MNVLFRVAYVGDPICLPEISKRSTDNFCRRSFFSYLAFRPQFLRDLPLMQCIFRALPPLLGSSFKKLVALSPPPCVGIEKCAFTRYFMLFLSLDQALFRSLCARFNRAEKQKIFRKSKSYFFRSIRGIFRCRKKRRQKIVPNFSFPPLDNLIFM